VNRHRCLGRGGERGVAQDGSRALPAGLAWTAGSAPPSLRAKYMMGVCRNGVNNLLEILAGPLGYRANRCQVVWGCLHGGFSGRQGGNLNLPPGFTVLSVRAGPKLGKTGVAGLSRALVYRRREAYRQAGLCQVPRAYYHEVAETSALGSCSAGGVEDVTPRGCPSGLASPVASVGLTGLCCSRSSTS